MIICVSFWPKKKKKTKSFCNNQIKLNGPLHLIIPIVTRTTTVLNKRQGQEKKQGESNMSFGVTVLLFGGCVISCSDETALKCSARVTYPRRPLERTTPMISPAVLWELSCQRLHSLLTETGSVSVQPNNSASVHATLQQLLEVSLLAVNDEFVDKEDRVTSLGTLDQLQSVAIVPPVSGG